MASRNRSRSRTSGAAISSSSGGAGLNRVPSSTSLATSSSSSTTHNSDPSSHTPPANVTEVLTLLHREIPSLRNEIRTLTDTNLSISSSISRSFDASKKANDRVASVYNSEKELFAKQLDRIIKSHALTSSEIAKEKAAILAELENLSSSFKNEKATLTQALAASQGRIEGLLRDAAAREVLLATASTNLSPQQSQHQQAQPSVYALQNALHEALLLNTKEVAMLRNELSTIEKDSALLTERTDALRNSISTFSASSTAEASQLLESAGKREFALRDVIDSMTKQTNEALASSAAAHASLEEDLAAAVRSANSAKESVNTLAASSYVEIDNARNVQEKALSSASLLRSSLLEVLSERDAVLSSLTTSLSEQVTSAKALGDSLAAREASHVKEERNREEEVTQLRETLINERAKFAEVEARLRVQVASANEASLDALRDKEVNDANALGNLHEIARKFAELERASASKEAEFVTVISDLRNALAASEQSVSAMRNSFVERSKNAESLLNRERSVFRASESAALLEVEKVTGRYNSLLREREVERSETAESIRLLKKEYDSKEDFYKSALVERDERIAALEASLSHAQARLVNATKISDKLGLGGGGGGGVGGAPGSMIERVSSLAKSSPSPLSGGNYLSSQSPNVFTKTTSSLSSPQQHPQHQNHQNSSVIRTLSSSSSSSLPYHQSAEEEGNAPVSSSPGNTAVPHPSSSSPLPYASSSSINKRYSSSSSSSQFATSSTSKTLGTTTAFDDAHFLSLSHVFGACALSIAWAQERSLSLSTQSALAESIATLQRALLENEASSSVSFAVRDQHEMELHELRASVSELRDDNSRLLSTLEPERALLLVKHEEMESGLSKAAEAFSTLSSSLSNALISLESLRSGLAQEGQVLKEANERDHLLFLSDSASLRNEVDTLRSTISIKTNEFVKDLEEVIKHRDQEISHLRSTASSESALAIETSRAQQLSIEALEESLRHSQEERAEKMALVETERAGFMSEVHILREECERLKKHDQERLAADKARASLYASELSRLANQNASIETEAANKVAESRKLFMRNVEERLEILRGEAQRARSTMRELNVAQDGRVAATTSLISSLTDTISGLVRSGVEVYKLSSVDNEATSALIVHMEKELVSVTNRFNAVRRTLEGEIDAARSALSGADKGGLIRIQSVLARAEPLLQRLSSASFSSSSSAGGAGASVEVSLLKVMVERLTALSNERKEVQSSSVANNNGGGFSSSSSDAAAPLLAKYNAAMTDIQVQREREKERAVELSALKETLSKYRSAAQAAAQAAIEAAAAAATVAVSNPDSAVHQSQNSSSSSLFSSQQQQQQHIITQKGHGLTSPALMARVSMGGGGGDKDRDRDVLPPPIIPPQQQQQSETTTTQTVSINLDDTTGEDDEE